MENNSIQLVPYEEKYFPSIKNYYLPNNQAIYTSLPVNALKQCDIEKETIPTIVLYKNELVGFFVLNYSKQANEYTDNDRSVVFKSFSIDQRYQGRKFAKESLNLLANFTRKMIINKNEIILTVHHTNLPAINLYKKCGFIDQGIRYAGEYGEELVMHLCLE